MNERLLNNIGIIESERRYLYVPYSENKKAKIKGARWCREKKLWYCSKKKEELFSKWHKEREKIYINSKYNDRREVRDLGGKWDKKVKSWYCYSNNKELLDRFKKSIII